jgi:hypothetical protein
MIIRIISNIVWERSNDLYQTNSAFRFLHMWLYWCLFIRIYGIIRVPLVKLKIHGKHIFYLKLPKYLLFLAVKLIKYCIIVRFRFFYSNETCIVCYFNKNQVWWMQFSNISSKPIYCQDIVRNAIGGNKSQNLFPNVIFISFTYLSKPGIVAVDLVVLHTRRYLNEMTDVADCD